MKNQANIAVYKSQYERFLAIKAEAERAAGRPLSWAEFTETVFDAYQAHRVPMVEMHQEEHMTRPEDMGLVPDDALTAEVGAILGVPVTLSDESCELIANKVAAKITAKRREP